MRSGPESRDNLNWTSWPAGALASTAATNVKTVSRTKADGERDRIEIPMAMRSMAEANFEPARKAFDKFIVGAQAAGVSLSARTASVGAGGKGLGAMAFPYAEKSVQGLLDDAQALAHAKVLSKVMRLQREFPKARMGALTEQAGEIGQTMSRTVMGVAKLKT